MGYSWPLLRPHHWLWNSLLWTTQRLEGTLQSLMNFIPQLALSFPPFSALRKSERSSYLWGLHLHWPRLLRNVITQRQAWELEAGLRTVPCGTAPFKELTGEQSIQWNTENAWSGMSRESQGVVKLSALQTCMEVLSVLKFMLLTFRQNYVDTVKGSFSFWRLSKRSVNDWRQ